MLFLFQNTQNKHVLSILSFMNELESLFVSSSSESGFLPEAGDDDGRLPRAS